MNPPPGQTYKDFKKHINQHAQRNDGQHTQQHHVLGIGKQPFKQNAAQAARTNQRRHCGQPDTADTQSGLNLPMYLKPPGAIYAIKPSWKATP